MSPLAADSESDPESTSSEPLVCRPARSIVWTAVFFLIMGLLIQVTAPLSTQNGKLWRDPIFWLGTGFIFEGPVVGILWMLWRCRTIADARGLTLVRMVTRRFVPWQDVTDFYRPSLGVGNRSKASGFYMEIKGKGKAQAQRLTTDYQHFDALLRRIEREAKWAKVQRFEHRETRDDSEWPKTFEYVDVSGWKLVLIYLLFALAWLSSLVLQAISNGVAPAITNFTMIWHELSFSGKIGFVFLIGATCGSMPLVFLAQYPGVLTRRQWLHRSVVATLEGLTFRDGHDERFVAWNEIESYHREALPGHFQPNVCVVQTHRGRFEFLDSITKGRVLCALIVSHAQQSRTREWTTSASHDAEVLGGEKSLWKGGIIGGTRVYHYRTRTNRAFLLFALGTVLMLLSVPLWALIENGSMTSLKRDDQIMVACFLTILGPPTLMGLGGWFRAYLQADETGLTQHSIWGKRFMAWHDVRELVSNGGWCRVRGEKSIIRFGIVAASSELKTAIETQTGLK